MAQAEELQTDVLVVGAGPSGLMLAVCLARLGVDAIIVDGKDGPTRESRALAVQARTMELYDQLGLVDRVLAERSPATTVVPGAGRRPFGRVELRAMGEGVTPYRELTVFEQSRTERMLVDALADLGREVRWGHRLARLETVHDDGDAASVIASLDGPDGPVTVRARYCVGADGAHSPVREALGVPFEGVTNAHTFYVADAVGVTGLVEEAINIRITAEHFLLAFPMGRERARLLGVMRDRDLDAAGQLREDDVRAMMHREFGVGYTEADWFATYRLHHRLAKRFRVGPCFLVGDAAHIHSPVGAQGMNTGLQEAHNLACALADVLVRGMPDRRLDRYEAERRPVGRILVDDDRPHVRRRHGRRGVRAVRARARGAGARPARRAGGAAPRGRQARVRLPVADPHPLPDVTAAVVAARPQSSAADCHGRATTSTCFGPSRGRCTGTARTSPRCARSRSPSGSSGTCSRPIRTGASTRDLVYLVRPDGFVAAAAPAIAVPGGPPAFREQLAG